MTTLEPANAVPTIGLRFEDDDIAPKVFLDASQCLLDILSEVGRSVLGRESLEWRLSELSLGSPEPALPPKSGAGDARAGATSGTLSGLAKMDETARRPLRSSTRITAPAPSDAVPTIGLHLEGDEVMAKTFVRAAQCLLDILSEVGRSVSGGKNLEWRFSDLSLGSARLAMQPKSGAAREHHAAAAISRTISGLAELAETAQHPAHFTHKALTRARTLGTLAAAAPERIRASSSGRSIAARTCSITRELATHARQAMRRPPPEFGSIDGILEAVSIHGQVAFVVYDPLTNDRVECRCDRPTLDRAVPRLGKRVFVSGEIHYRADGEPMSLQVDSLDIPDERSLLEVEDVRGPFAGGPFPTAESARCGTAK